MLSNNIRNVKVSDSLKIHFQVLSWVGFYRPMIFYHSRAKRIFHKIYRNCVLFLMIVYNFQHAIFAVKSLGVMDELIAAMLILLTTINNICKIITLYLNTDRLNRILEIMDGPYFAPLDTEDVKILKKNAKVMRLILKPCHISVVLCCTMWCIAPFISRAKGENVLIPGYYPFNTDSTAGFTVMVLYENILMTWVGIGHTTIDCLIASFYILVKAQLQMLRHQLANIADDNDVNCNVIEKKATQKYLYKDCDELFERKLKQRLIHNVKKYEEINWLIEEVQSIFNNAIVVQLLVSACILCVVVYKMVQMVSLSFDFFYLFQYNFSLGMQLFLYCYFGSQAEYESLFVNDSIYASEWISLSPKFRRLMLIAMARWSRSIKPSAAYIIPMSLSTFIGVLRISYSLYTLLKKTSN